MCGGLGRATLLLVLLQHGRHGGEATPGHLPLDGVGAVTVPAGRSAQAHVSSARLHGAECPSTPSPPSLREKVFWA